MPIFEISTTGGQFLSASTWVGGVVPTSATSSDIYGSSTSGPLIMTSIGSRTVGSWLMADYANTLSFTGSTVNIVVTGPTFSMNSGITSSVTALGNIHRFQIASSIAAYGQQRLVMNGYRFKCGLNFVSSTIPTEIVDEVIFDENGNLQIGSLAGTIVRSATSSVRGKITFDPGTGRFAYLQTGLASTSANWYPHFLDIYFKNTTGSTNSVLLSSGGADTTIAYGSNLILDGGTINTTNTSIQLGMNCNFEYISGTVSPYKSIVYNLLRQTATFNSSTHSVKSNGIDWDTFVIYNRTATTNVVKADFNFDNSFQAKDLVVISQTQAKTIQINASQSFNISKALTLNSMMPTSNTAAGVNYFGETWLSFVTGKTYSIATINSASTDLDTYVGTTGGLNFIYGTGSGQANLDISGDTATKWTNFTNINATNKKIYALNATITNSTNVESSLPTGSGGGASSYVYIN